jgi:thiamine biosynthesis lipoprotein
VLTLPHIRQRVLDSSRSSQSEGGYHLEFQAMASRCRITFGASSAAARDFQRALLTWVADFEATYSRFVPESLVTRINASAGKQWSEVDSTTENILGLCHEAHSFSRGIFDPTALPLIQLWNWKANPPVVPSDAAIQEARLNVGWNQVQRKPGKIFLPGGMSLDLGGIGKEYAVDQAASLASEFGIKNVLVDFGQDVLARGTPSDGRPAWHIGLEDPAQPGKCWTSLGVKDMAVATSGDYYRRFEIAGQRYGHILDVRTGYPVANGCRAVSVLAPSCSVAGMLATTIFVLGPQEGLKMLDLMPGFAGCILLEKSQLASRRFYEHVVT